MIGGAQWKIRTGRIENKLEDRSIGIVWSKEQEEKRMKNKEACGTPSRVHKIGVPESKEKKKRKRKNI